MASWVYKSPFAPRPRRSAVITEGDGRPRRPRAPGAVARRRRGRDGVVALADAGERLYGRIHADAAAAEAPPDAAGPTATAPALCNCLMRSQVSRPAPFDQSRAAAARDWRRSRRAAARGVILHVTARRSQEQQRRHPLHLRLLTMDAALADDAELKDAETWPIRSRPSKRAGVSLTVHLAHI